MAWDAPLNVAEDATNYIASRTEFDALGRAYRINLPQRRYIALTTTIFDP